MRLFKNMVFSGVGRGGWNELVFKPGFISKIANYLSSPKGHLKWNFHFVFYYIDILVSMCSAQRHHFNDIIVHNYWDVKSQSNGYIILINIMMHDPDRMYFYFMC